MRIRSFVHKGLKRLYTEDNPRGLSPKAVDKIRKILAFIQNMENADELRSIPSMEGAPDERRSQRHMEPARHAQLAPDVQD